MKEAADQEQQFLRHLSLVAPGTQLYESLENVLRARTGGLIVVGDTPEIMSMVNGGFKIDAEMHPRHCMNWPRWTARLFYPATPNAFFTRMSS